MSNDNEEGNMGSTVWQSQPLDAPRISLEFVRFHAEKVFNADLRRLLYLGYAFSIFAAVLVALPTFLLVVAPSSKSIALIGRLGSLLLLTATAFLVFQICRRVKMLSYRSDSQVMESLDAYHAELLRRRNHYLESWRWLVWPIIPSLVVFSVGWMLIEQRPNKLLRCSLFAGFFMVGVLLGVWQDKREGRKYQRELDALATLDKKLG